MCISKCTKLIFINFFSEAFGYDLDCAWYSDVVSLLRSAQIQLKYSKTSPEKQQRREMKKLYESCVLKEVFSHISSHTRLIKIYFFNSFLKICKNIKNGKILIYDFCFFDWNSNDIKCIFWAQMRVHLAVQGWTKKVWLETTGSWLKNKTSTATSPLTSPLGEEESLFHMPSRSLLSIFAKCCFILREYNLLHPLLFRIIHNRIEIFFSSSWFTRHDKCSATSNRFTKCCVSEKNIFKDGRVCCCSCCCRFQVWRIDVKISS